MKDLFVGLSAALTAAAGLFALAFERLFADTTRLQNDLVRAGVDVGAAKTQADNKRRKQKLRSLGAILMFAFAFSVVALFVNNGKPEHEPSIECGQRTVAACFDALDSETKTQQDEIQRLAHSVDVLSETLKHAEVEVGAH